MATGHQSSANGIPENCYDAAFDGHITISVARLHINNMQCMTMSDIRVLSADQLHRRHITKEHKTQPKGGGSLISELKSNS